MCGYYDRFQRLEDLTQDLVHSSFQLFQQPSRKGMALVLCLLIQIHFFEWMLFRSKCRKPPSQTPCISCTAHPLLFSLGLCSNEQLECRLLAFCKLRNLYSLQKSLRCRLISVSFSEFLGALGTRPGIFFEFFNFLR